MRRLMAAEASAAASRGETIEEKSSDDDDEDSNSHVSDEIARQLLNMPAKTVEAGPSKAPAKPVRGGLVMERPLRRIGDFDDDDDGMNSGHEADMDDTSMSSRASSRLMGESMDSISAM